MLGEVHAWWVNWDWDLYGEMTNGITGNGHMGSSRGQTDRQKDTTENITFPHFFGAW